MSTSDNNMRFTNRVSLDKFYRNSRNNIEDPIFTGFTFDIDTLNSPLFFSLCGDEYTESLRSLSGTNIDLSDKIEKKLSNVYKFSINGAPDSYEINSIYTKDMLGDNHKAGYGLQEIYNLDNPLYGAVDYIYMVDKVSSGKYVDESGVVDLGNGLSTNVYIDAYNVGFDNKKEMQIQKIQEKMSDANYNIDEDEQEELNMTVDEGFSQKIQNLESKMSEKKEEHDKNITDRDNYQRENNIEGRVKEIEDKEKDIKKYDVSHSRVLAKINTELDDYINRASTLLNRLNSTSSMKEPVKTEITTLFNEYCSYYGIDTETLQIKNPITITKPDEPGPDELKLDYNVYLSVPDEKKINSEINGVNSKNKELYGDYYKKVFLIKNTSIYNLQLSENEQNELIRLKEEKKKFEEELYGTHKDGIPGTKSNPAEGSIYGNYIELKNKADNDDYSNAKAQKEDYQYYKDIYPEAKEYYDSTRGKYANSYARYDDQGYKDVTNNEFQISYDNEHRYDKETFEVPQTVYDMMGFINGMKDITTKFPYVLQSVSGLDEAYKKYFEVKDPYMGSGDDKITIECLEFLDLKVSSMFNKYFNAVYDRQYRRERVPINLRRFNCSIFVHDIRNFKDSLNYDSFDAGFDFPAIVEMALNYISAIEFKFYDCEIIPEETGGIFEDVSNIPTDDMRKTHFTFKYGNCVINFLPFEDLRRYLIDKPIENIKPKVTTNTVGSTNNEESISYADEGVDDGNFRRWFDKSVLGNVSNNDYRDYVRHDSSVAVDDHYKTTIVNDFALNSVVNKNQQLTEMDDALRKLVVGISASTGIPPKGVTDALNIGFIDPIINGSDEDVAVVKNIGNVNNSKVIDEKTMEYIGEAMDKPEQKVKYIDFLGNVNDDNKEKGGN